ncbi:BrnA antitoxin family protein [Beijerinckia sp. L45]|uniref:BrnA antitoxin family protein n=1 Tax=Beijerinckia sp. L45 TaxID=1641855 RepID=UPI00131C1F8D|nr:BrnA antitoxin family protein [Beijerinckia sp. L45]
MTDALFDNAVLHENGKPVKRGRPFGEHPKERTTMRLDADVVAFYRATGSGWQGRVNGLLRQAAKLQTKA